jgi:hypothetical protein
MLLQISDKILVERWSSNVPGIVACSGERTVTCGHPGLVTGWLPGLFRAQVDGTLHHDLCRPSILLCRPLLCLVSFSTSLLFPFLRPLRIPLIPDPSVLPTLTRCFCIPAGTRQARSPPLLLRSFPPHPPHSPGLLLLSNSPPGVVRVSWPKARRFLLLLHVRLTQRLFVARWLGLVLCLSTIASSFVDCSTLPCFCSLAFLDCPSPRRQMLV